MTSLLIILGSAFYLAVLVTVIACCKIAQMADEEQNENHNHN